MLEISAPAVTKRFKRDHAAQQINIPPIGCIQAHDVRYRNPMTCSGNTFDHISCLDTTLLCHCEVETAALTLQEPLHHIRTSEANPQLVARHARLGRAHPGRTDAKFIPDPNLFFQEPRRGEILAKHSPRQGHVR